MPTIVDMCRALRRTQTYAESILWKQLKNRQLAGYTFLRQHPVFVSKYGKMLYYIPDFYCAGAQLVIEADGPIHLLKKDYDKNRDEVLAGLGLKTLRFTNDEIINNTNEVLEKIKQALETNSPGHRSARPPSLLLSSKEGKKQ
jgi:very-short-patch-repair endonuclease